MEPLLSLEHICRYYQSGETVVKALDDVSLRIHAGEFVAIMGQSGSGKSTLMNIFGCLDRPTSGRYIVNGHDVATLSDDALAALRRKSFGFIFQRYNLLSTASAEENVEIPALYSGISKAPRRQRASQLLRDLSLGDRMHHRPGALSGGQQQRVAIARALMNDPPVILADEPTGALDTHSSSDVMALLEKLHSQGRTVIVITHDKQTAAYAKRIISLQDGRVIADTGTEHDQKQIVIQPVTVTDGHDGNLISEAQEAVKTAFRALRVNIFRTALTLLGIIIGVAAVITMLAVGNGSKQKVLDQISTMGTNILSIRPGPPGIRSSSVLGTLTMEDADSLRGISNVSVVVPERSGVKTLRFDNIDYATSVVAVSPGFPIARDWPIMAGSFFSLKDMESYSTVAVLGRIVAETFFPGGRDPVGQYILIDNIPFQIIGVMAEKGAAPWGRDQDDAVWIPVTTSLIRLFGSTYLDGITIKVNDTAEIAQTEQLIRALLISRHGSEDFTVRNTASYLEMANETQNTLTILLGTIAAISLLVGGIGVMNIMLVSVTERTREIGIRMAVGARMRDIMIQFITEAAVVCTIGGFAGVLAGIGAGTIISLFEVNILFTAGPAILAFSCSVMIGLIFGYLPARKAARLDPVAALSVE